MPDKWDQYKSTAPPAVIGSSKWDKYKAAGPELMPEIPKPKLPRGLSAASDIQGVGGGGNEPGIPKIVNEGIHQLWNAIPSFSNSWKGGLSDVIEGAGKTLSPLVIPAVGLAPVPTAMGAAGAMVGGGVGTFLSDLFGGGEETRRLAGNVGSVVGGSAASQMRPNLAPLKNPAVQDALIEVLPKGKELLKARNLYRQATKNQNVTAPVEPGMAAQPVTSPVTTPVPDVVMEPVTSKRTWKDVHSTDVPRHLRPRYRILEDLHGEVGAHQSWVKDSVIADKLKSMGKTRTEWMNMPMDEKNSLITSLKSPDTKNKFKPLGQAGGRSRADADLIVDVGNLLHHLHKPKK